MASKKSILLLFDVDRTLTKPGQVISAELLDFLLNKVKPVASIGLISSSDYPKVVEKLNGEENTNKFDYVFCDNGVLFYKNGKLIKSESILSIVGESTLQSVINFALGYMSEIQLPAKRGNFVEFRSSMINICPVGRSCSQAERDEFIKYDTENGIRKKFVEALQNEFSDTKLCFTLGGQISIDIYPATWDKTICRQLYIGYEFREIHYYGGMTMQGSDDYSEAYYDNQVTSPEDIKKNVQKLLNIE
ncbi:phosphomannomutase-like [Aricia agestis]|uniref:phosphomannomutase-like n=1 Tax=Aricia agestis TaxID=91739 RepID=UPI001C20C187|nr:phosphomannomutase-like [Aricia agestis]